MTEQEALFEYTLRLGDTSLILGHRLSEWCGHGPVLEEDIALINISLDLVGQARTLLAHAGELEGKGRDEDALAYLRREPEFRNVMLAELPNGHFGDTIARQFFFDAYYQPFLAALAKSSNATFAAFAEKSLKEVNYHVRHSAEWMVRLGDGTEESHEKIQTSVNDLWRYTGELFEMDEVDHQLIEAGIVPDLSPIRDKWLSTVQTVADEATLTLPSPDAWMMKGGKKGNHTEHMGYLLADLQYMQRAYPGMTW